jgi:hypothetical protein
MKARSKPKPYVTFPTIRPRGLTTDDAIRVAFYRGQKKSVREIASLVNVSKTTVGEMVHSYHHLFENEAEADFLQSDFVGVADFNDSYLSEQWLLRHYLIYIVAENPTLSVRRIADMLQQGEIPVQGTEDESM